MTITIERAQPADAAEILALQKLAYRQEAALYDDYSIAPLRQTLAELEAQFQDHTILKAVSAGRIVGSVRACLVDGTLLIGRLITQPERQGQGVGTQLLAAIEAAFPQARRYELFTGDRSTNNLRFYAKRGYREFKRVAAGAELVLVYLEKLPALSSLPPSS